MLFTCPCSLRLSLLRAPTSLRQNTCFYIFFPALKNSSDLSLLCCSLNPLIHQRLGKCRCVRVIPGASGRLCSCHLVSREGHRKPARGRECGRKSPAETEGACQAWIAGVRSGVRKGSTCLSSRASASVNVSPSLTCNTICDVSDFLSFPSQVLSPLCTH